LDETKGVDLNEVGKEIMASSRSGPSSAESGCGKTKRQDESDSIKTTDERYPLKPRSNNTSDENTATAGEGDERTAPDWEESKNGWIYN
ncbi:hypothetical protein PENTCL1PPCAC_25545, partial [Pristionchus entomophagus]